MRINGGVTDNIPRRTGAPVGREAPAGAGRGGAGQAELYGGRAAATAMGNQRALSEALTIANTARSIINRALEVSAQLQAMAAQTITSGSADQGALNRTVAEINSAISTSAGLPVFTVIPPAIEGKGAEPRQVEIPTPRRELETLGRAAGVIARRGNFDGENLGEVNRALAQKNTALDAVLEEIEAAAGSIAGRAAVRGTGNAVETVRETAKMMNSAPASALAAQGNIRHEGIMQVLS